MAETEPKTPGVPEVKDKRIRVPGLLPKNAQARVLGGIALLMIVIITLSGRQTPPGRPPAPVAAGPAALDPNPARIQEYRARIEEQARKLAAEEAQLAQAKETMGLVPGERLQSSPSGAPRVATPAESPLYARTETVQNWIETEREKREYQALFASNVALSYRKTGTSMEPQAAIETPAALPTRETARATSAATKDRKNGEAANRAAGKEYRLFEGTVFETVLTNRLDGSFSGPVNCMLTTNVYSHDRQRLLIPQGSRVLGEVKKLDSLGQQRLAVTFHRIIMPDGFAKSLDEFQGLNQIGETGLRDQVNHHYLQIFGASLAIGAIAGLSQANTRYGDTSAGDVYRQGVSASLAQSSLHILDRYLNVLPTFTIREGHRVKVYLSGDLMLPAYEAHQMPSDL